MVPPRRSLGRSPLRVAPLSFGGNVFGWTVDDETGFRLLDEFVAKGYNLIDTADVYSSWVPGHVGGESESFIGRWLERSGRRDEVILATKVGFEMGSGAKGLSKEHIAASVKGSLQRLRTDRIDLYQAHGDDAATPLDETLEAFAALIDQGTVRAIGASNYTAERLQEALEVSRRRGLPRYESLQPRYNLVDRAEFEQRLRPVCEGADLGVLTYSSLASGFLSGKYRSASDLGKSPRGSRAAARLDERGHRVLAALDTVAQRVGATPAAVAIAWLVARPGVTTAIASATSLSQFRELDQGAALRLDATATSELDRASG